MRHRLGAALSLVALLSACGGGGGGSGGSSGGTPVAGGPAPTPTASGCALRERQLWAQQQMREWYLFPETLPATLDPAPYANVADYVDALTATARGQRRDRYFTYVTSIAEENAFYNSGSSAGFGIRLSTDSAARRVTVAEAFEGAPALAQGIDRGTEIVAIGATEASLRSVSDIIATEGDNGVTNALGPTTAGTSRLLRVRDPGGATRDVFVTKTDFALTPVSPRYGAKIIEEGGRKIGYLNLRTFISTADPQLRDAFALFRAQGATELIIDLRYNGGGLVSIAELIGDLLGRDRFSSEVFSFTTFRPEKASENETRRFSPRAQSVAPTKIAFIGTGGTASASELVINGMLPYLRERVALVGADTYGKPVGQIALDRAACDDRLRVVAFATQNADRQGDYYDGLAGTVQASCQAPDDVLRPFGDAQEGSVKAALDFLAGRPCTPIATGQRAQAVRGRALLSPERPSTAQREVPGLF